MPARVDFNRNDQIVPWSGVHRQSGSPESAAHRSDPRRKTRCAHPSGFASGPEPEPSASSQGHGAADDPLDRLNARVHGPEQDETRWNQPADPTLRADRPSLTDGRTCKAVKQGRIVRRQYIPSESVADFPHSPKACLAFQGRKPAQRRFPRQHVLRRKRRGLNFREFRTASQHVCR